MVARQRFGEAIGPFDGQDRAGLEQIEKARGIELVDASEPIEIHVGEAPPARCEVLVRDREGRAGDVGGVDPEPLRHPFGERRLARSERTHECHHETLCAHD